MSGTNITVWPDFWLHFTVFVPLNAEQTKAAYLITASILH